MTKNQNQLYLLISPPYAYIFVHLCISISFSHHLTISPSHYTLIFNQLSPFVQLFECREHQGCLQDDLCRIQCMFLQWEHIFVDAYCRSIHIFSLSLCMARSIYSSTTEGYVRVSTCTGTVDHGLSERIYHRDGKLLCPPLPALILCLCMHFLFDFY